MKKNISINISGIIFHIEEDGYEQLRNYLDTINGYFSAYEDSAEIIADIESRIAEIFLARLKEGKQVITATDVQSLVATMGSIADFEAIEEEPKFNKREEKRASYQQERKQSYGTRKLYRDTKRKILGGVAAGIGHYFNLDPLWIRLIMIILLFDLFITYSIGTIIFIGYIICWIVVPPSDTIEEDRKLKKLYRNPEDRVLGGVSGGLAAYFGIDSLVVRILFIISIFAGGAGILIYIILWIITPEAKTITDKMQMQGEPVTLANIEHNIKKSLNVRDGEEENLLVKILLFPFRLISIIFTGLAKAIGPLLIFIVEAIRVIFGIAIVLLSATLLFSLFMASGIYFNFLNGGWMAFPNVVTDFPLDMLHQSFSPLLFFSSFFSLFVPFLSLAILGAAVLAKRSVLNATVGWSLFALWLISLACLAITLPVTIKSFSRQGSDRIVQTFDFGDKTPVLALKETGLEDYQATTLRILGNNEPEYKLVQKFSARGSTRQNALENAKMVEYHVVLNDSILTFDSNIQFKEEAIFRGQELDMTFYIPYNKPFVMQENLKHIIGSTLYSNGYTISQLEGNQWMFTEEGLQCLTCPPEKEEEPSNAGASNKDEEGVSYRNITGFDNLEINGIYEVTVRQGAQYTVHLSGDEEVTESVAVKKIGNTLKIAQEGLNTHGNFLKPEVRITITMPTLTATKFSGITRSYVEGFDMDHLEVELSGSSRAEFNVKVKDIDLALSGDAKLTLIGKGNYMQADLSGACRLFAEEFPVENATVEASGASNAVINAANVVESKASGASTIENKNQNSTAGASSPTNQAFYMSKAIILYYAALLKEGLVDDQAYLNTYFNRN